MVRFDILVLKVVGSGGAKHLGGKSHCSSAGSFASPGCIAVLYVDSYLAAAGLSHSR